MKATKQITGSKVQGSKVQGSKVQGLRGSRVKRFMVYRKFEPLIREF